jgi:ADP-heptose:LPS heptosyltransferase
MRLPHLPFKFPAAIFGNAFGDHLLTLPALRALAALFSGRLSLICMPGARREFFRDLRLRSVCEIKMPMRGRRERVISAARVAERVGKCDLFLSLNPWHSRSIERLLKLLSPALSVGFAPAFQVALPKGARTHRADLVFGVPSYLHPGLRIEDFAYPPRLPAQCRPRVRRFLRWAAPGMRVLAVHTETKADKTWPRERFSEVMNSFLERHPEFVILVLDFRKWRGDAGKFKDRIIQSPHLPLPYALSMVGESDLFLGVNSCMLHAADLFRVPGVGLFEPKGDRRWGFRFSPHRHLCDARGLKYIRAPRVLEALESLLRPTGRRSLRKAM